MSGTSELNGRAVGAEQTLTCGLRDASDPRVGGGKAWNLSRLLGLGVQTPDGVVLTSAALDAFLDASDLRGRVEELARGLDSSDLPGLAAAAARIAELIHAAPMPPQVEAALRGVGRELGGGVTVAVRSSAVGEDGRCDSFAGQFDTVLGVAAPDDLSRAVRTCWASCWSERALSYRIARRAQFAGMGVVVQRQIDPVVSGVLFTREPAGAAARPDDESMLVEYAAGLGDALVSGRVDPGRRRVSRRDFAVTVLEELPDPVNRAPVAAMLTPSRIAELARTCAGLEQPLGGPQDVEWAIDREGRTWILQARPITTPAAVAPGDSVLWSNANVNENFPDPVSPLLYSIASRGYYHYFRNLGLAFGVSRRRLAAMDRPLRGVIGVHGGRMYYNLTNIHAVLRMAPYGERLTEAFNAFVGADRIATAPPGASAWRDRRSRVGQAAEVVRIAVQVACQYARLGRRVASFERTADDFAARTRPELLADRALPDLAADLAAFLDIRFHRWKDASLADTAAMVSYAMLRRSLARAGAGPTLHNRLLRALPGVPSSRPPVRLWELSRLVREDGELRALFGRADAATILREVHSDERWSAFRAELSRFLEDWGFRSSGELMLTLPSLQEEPAPVIDMLRQYAEGGDADPADAMARQAAERVAETSKLLRSLRWRSPWRALAVWRWLTWTQRSIAYRERARLKQALLYTRCRRVALAIGDRLVRAGILRGCDDVFWLTRQEIDELCAGRAMFPYRVPDLVERRRTEHAELSRMRPPDTFRIGDAEYLRRDPAAAREASAAAPDGEVLAGASVCGGRVTAPAAVLESMSEAHRLSRGDVLVTRQTDPGWGPVFCLVSGLVMERGGMLSHGAIIAREFGLPCVVGVKDAVRRIPHGARITVDGDGGTCIVERAAAESRS